MLHGESMSHIRRRPRALKSPQGLPTIALHVRIVLPAYQYLETEALTRGISMARMLSEILLSHRLEKMHRLRATIRPPDEKSGTTD